MITTPIYDFISHYISAGTVRLHMPGHKGRGPLGIEARDITEVSGADVLTEAGGIILESEKNASSLFGSARTVYSTEGSSLSIRAMLYLALLRYKKTAASTSQRPIVLAARNAHKVFLYTAALLDLDIEWIYPEDSDLSSVCACHPTAESVKAALDRMERKPFAVYITSPDYLGTEADIKAISGILPDDIPLLVDNAHGAYLRFLKESRHPLDLGAYMCVDSAHKTLPVLTGGGWLHLSEAAEKEIGREANAAMALFASTSPSYIILQSLDLCCRYLEEGYRDRLSDTIKKIDSLKAHLSAAGIPVLPSEPLKLVLRTDLLSMTGEEAADHMRSAGIEPEFADIRCLVFMLTPENTDDELARLKKALLSLKAASRDAASGTVSASGNSSSAALSEPLVLLPLPRAMSVREAVFSPHEAVPAEFAAGRILGQPSVSCPPAVPIAVSGERLTEESLRLFKAYGIDTLSVVAE